MLRPTDYNQTPDIPGLNLPHGMTADQAISHIDEALQTIPPSEPAYQQLRAQRDQLQAWQSRPRAPNIQGAPLNYPAAPRTSGLLHAGLLSPPTASQHMGLLTPGLLAQSGQASPETPQMIEGLNLPAGMSADEALGHLHNAYQSLPADHPARMPTWWHIMQLQQWKENNLPGRIAPFPAVG